MRSAANYGIVLSVLAVLFGGEGTLPANEPAGWKAGVASCVITPNEPLWMAGYASRDKPATEKEHDLFVKALALEDPRGEKLVLLTSDVCGFGRSLTEPVAEEVRKRTGLTRDRLLFNASHTHCGPVLGDNLIDMYPMPAEEAGKIGPYTDKVRDWMVRAILAALADLQPARLAVGQGLAGFAVNRREPAGSAVTNNRYPAGPVDHSVPVLRVTTPEGKLRAVVFGYACHNTTMQYYKWSGDYAGFAQQYLEEKHPGALALFWIGCGGDSNPLPRSKIELCRRYGKELAGAVENVLARDMTPVQGTSAARYATVELPYEKVPGREQLTADLLNKNRAISKRAARLLKALENGGKIEDRYRHYPVQVWRLGDQVLWVALGGEVVIDYARRLKNELVGSRPVWVAGYCNDVMAYIPSARVLREGGYEGESSMIYYGLPSKWGAPIEEIIVGKVYHLVKETENRR